ncbi:hypothetical protein B0H14DRAFT_3468713 [Mycena olivaceomarginata]|nr:hypothetical protein B0H14DRAFT_3468713 [Mycena olivaceomarginata]
MTENTVVLNKEPCGTLNDDGCLQIFPYFDGPSGSLCMNAPASDNLSSRARAVASAALNSQSHSVVAASVVTVRPKDCLILKLMLPLHVSTFFTRGWPITNNTVIGPTTSAAELEAIRTAKSGGHFTVHVFYTTKGVVNKNIGNHSFNLPMDMHLDDVLARAVAHADLEWTADSTHPLSLKVKDCSLHFKGNMSIEPEALSGTLRGLYNFYIGRPDKIHVTANNRLGLAKGTYLAFECSINVQHLKARYAEDDDGGSLVSNKRRSNNSSSGEPTKRRRGTGTLSSNVRFANNLGALGYGAPQRIHRLTFQHLRFAVELGNKLQPHLATGLTGGQGMRACRQHSVAVGELLVGGEDGVLVVDIGGK